MPMADDDKSGGDPLLGILVGGVVGGVLTKAWMDLRAGEAIKSRAEIEQPELHQAVLQVPDGVFNRVKFRGEFKSERHIMNGLARYLRSNTDLGVEVEPSTPFGIPHILLEGVVALELKKGLRTAEMDRCVGQAAGVSRRWFTIIVVFETPISRVQAMEDLMPEQGLDHIPVVHFTSSA